MVTFVEFDKSNIPKIGGDRAKLEKAKKKKLENGKNDEQT